MSIKPLNNETIKLINSTQVISSIFSAVKELVENSLDAQSQNVEVNLVDNGLSLIEVKDNGVGICREDAPYMALPSYTSKISDFNDLDLLSTYGFRGEGLTAVCQVSDVRICTKTDNDEAMMCYNFNKEGHVVTSELSHGLTGTTVQMRNLFKNMPVRRNILNNKKKINQEIKNIELLLKTYAICKPLIRIIFRVNSAVIFMKPSCKNITEAIKSVLGLQIFSKLYYINKNCPQVEMQLFVPKKEVKDCTEVSQVGLQFFCVNDRPIKSKEIEKKINKRISEYFNQETSNSRKFIFCLILKVDPSILDVNLEPNKDRVFLHNESTVLAEIDNCLLNYYELQDSQVLTQNDEIIEILNPNKYLEELELIDEKEKEWPVCKKRKLDTNNEIINDINQKSEDVTNTKQNGNMKKSDDDFLKDINGPVLSDSDSDQEKKTTKRKLNKENDSKIIQTPDEDSEIFDLAQYLKEKSEVIEETLSQLPEVDLGEDFDWQEISNKCKTSDFNVANDVNIEKQEITDITWSKGQVPDLRGGVTIETHANINNNANNEKNLQKEEIQQDSEPFDFLEDVEKINDSENINFNDNIPFLEAKNFDWNISMNNERKTTKKNSDKQNMIDVRKPIKKTSNINVDPTQTKIPFAGDNACLNRAGPSAFAMYCIHARAKIVKENPEFTPVEVAACLNEKWKEISPDEREYYRELANKHNQSTIASNSSQTSKKPRSQLPQTEKEKNKKLLINMLENMKMKKAELKNESMIMRNFVVWNTNMPIIKEKFAKSIVKEEKTIVGSINSFLWIVKLMLNIFVFDIRELQNQLNIKNNDTSQINVNYVKALLDQWLKEKNDMSIFHLLHSIET